MIGRRFGSGGRVRGAAFAALVLGTVAWVGPAFADLGFPDTVKLPKQIRVDPDQALVAETFGNVELEVDAQGTKQELRGKHFARWFKYVPAAGEPALGYYDGSEERIQKALLSSLAPTGWHLAFDTDQHGYFTLKREAAGAGAWMLVKMDAPAGQVYLEVVEVGGAAVGVTLPKPSKTPEKIADQGDIPYLPPYPGSKADGGGRGNGALDLSQPGKGGEPMLVGTAVMNRRYLGPSTLSNLQFVSDFRAAFTAAGWTVLWPSDQDAAGSGSVAAHYAADGRDVWALVTYEFGAHLTYSVVDLATEDWGSKLDKECHVPLYGVFFDFDKATIKPESAGTLTKAAALIAATKGPVEIQGHTDAVGADAYNQKLSEARAAAVKTWLAGHGIAADRLTSHGYGKTMPVADNATDAGRAKNRRVELAKPGCKKG